MRKTPLQKSHILPLRAVASSKTVCKRSHWFQDYWDKEHAFQLRMFWFLFVTSFLWSWVAGLTVWEGGGEEVCRPLSHCKQSKIDSLPIESLHCGVEYFVQNRYPIFFKFSSRENLAKANWSFAAVLNHIQAQTCTALISPTDKSGSHWKSILASSFLKWEPLPA